MYTPTNTLTPEELKKLRALEERRMKLAKEIAAIDAERVELLGISTTARKPAHHMLDRATRERLILGSTRK